MKLLAATRVVADESAPPERWAVFLHGILGTGANWRSFARRFVQARPEFGALLVDLRMHGASKDLPPPHTIQQCAKDVVELSATLDAPIAQIIGHSFGGKVALAYVDQVYGELDRAVILDSTPGARPDARGSETTVRILELLEQMPPLPLRQAFLDRVVATGQSLAFAQWLAMNLEKRGEHFVVGLDLSAIRALLDDYFVRDLWEVVEHPPGRVKLELVLGGRSNVFDAAERARLASIAQRMPDRVLVDELENAGHWVHVDDPEGTARILLRE